MIRLARPWIQGLLKAMGLGGFVALLLLGQQLPVYGPALRWMALFWFAGFGVAKCVLDLERR